LFSATLPSNITKLSGKYMRDPVRVAVGSTSTPAANIKQEVIPTTDADKYGKLVEQLDARKGSIIIFVKTKYGTEKLADKLNKNGHKADAIHGDLQQRRRERVIQNFRDKKYRILVATDVAARGLDIPHIEHVVNYDMPQAPEDYIHRIGRTARAGAEGEAVSFLTGADNAKWRAIQRLMSGEDPNTPQARSGGGGARRGFGGGGGRKPFWKRDGDKPAGDRPRGERSYGDKPRSERSFGDKPRGERSFGDKPRGERSFSSDKPRGDRPHSDRPRGERTFGDKPRSDRPHSDKPRGERSFSDRPRSDRPHSERPRNEGAASDRPRSERSFSDRPHSDKPRSDRPHSDKPRGDKPFGDRPRGGKPFSGKPRSEGGKKPHRGRG